MLQHAFYESPLGPLHLAFEEECLTDLALADRPAGENRPTSFSDRVYKQVLEYLEGERFSFDLPYRLEGSAFQKKVLDALSAIPYGTVATYGEIAEKIGSPRSARAVGNPCHKNRLLLIIPCHRVVGKGNLGGYGGRMDIKEFLLSLEYNNFAKQYSLNT